MTTLHPSGADDPAIGSAPPPSSGSKRAAARPARPAASVEAWSAPKLIGVGVDGNPGGRDAVALGSLLARPTRGEVMLIGVHEEPLVQVPVPEEVGWSALEEQTREMLADTRQSLVPDARIAVHADVLVWRALRHVVRLEHRDVLVVGSAHDAKEGRTRLGRTVDELLCHLERPLVIAPSGMRNRETRGLERIGVGFDGNPESQAALGLARSIAAAARAELEVRAAVDGAVDDENGPTAEQLALEGGAPVRFKVNVGMPPDILSELADRVDLLIIGSGRAGPPGRVQLGATGRALLDWASCPVLVVPRPAKAGASAHPAAR